MRSTISLNPSKRPLLEDILIINEAISDHSEVAISNSKKKMFLGRDLVDRIYFCPMNNIVVLDYNETNKIGILLLRYIRLEEQVENQQLELNAAITEISEKYEMCLKIANEHTEKLREE